MHNNGTQHAWDDLSGFLAPSFNTNAMKLSHFEYPKLQVQSAIGQDKFNSCTCTSSKQLHGDSELSNFNII